MSFCLDFWEFKKSRITEKSLLVKRLNTRIKKSNIARYKRRMKNFKGCKNGQRKIVIVSIASFPHPI